MSESLLGKPKFEFWNLGERWLWTTVWVLGIEEPNLLTTKYFLQPPDMGPWVRGAKEVMSFQFFILFYFFMCLSACLQVCMCTTFMPGQRSPKPGVIDGCKLPRGCWGQNPDPLQEQWVLLSAERSLKGPTINLQLCFNPVWFIGCTMWLIWL